MSVREDQLFRYEPAEHDHHVEGELVTPELLERAAQTAEAPAGDTPRPWLKPGGTSLSDGGTTHSARFQVVLGEATAAEMRAAAEAAGMSISRWLRQLVEREVA